MLPQKYEIRDSDSCRPFSLLKAIAKRLPLLFANAFKIIKERQLYGKQYRKEAMNKSTILMQKFNKETKSDNFCYRKVGTAITNCGTIEKSPILLSKYWKNYHFQIYFRRLYFSHQLIRYLNCSV